MKPAPRFGLLVVVLLAAVPLFAQFTTGQLVGTVTDADGSPLQGVTITISSPALQGTRTIVSGEGGGYHFPALPPGVYSVSFDLEGMQHVTKHVTVSLAQTARADADLK